MILDRCTRSISLKRRNSVLRSYLGEVRGQPRQNPSISHSPPYHSQRKGASLNAKVKRMTGRVVVEGFQFLVGTQDIQHYASSHQQKHRSSERMEPTCLVRFPQKLEPGSDQLAVHAVFCVFAAGVRRQHLAACVLTSRAPRSYLTALSNLDSMVSTLPFLASLPSDFSATPCAASAARSDPSRKCLITADMLLVFWFWHTTRYWCNPSLARRGCNRIESSA